MFKTKSLPLASFFRSKPELAIQLRKGELSKKLELKSNHSSVPLLLLEACIKFFDYKTLELASKTDPGFVRVSNYKPVDLAFKGLDAIALMIIWPAIELSKKKSLTQAPNNWLSTYIGEFEKLQNASAALKQETRKPQKHIIPIATHYCELANTWLNVLKKLIEQRSAYITTTEMTWVADNEFASLKVIEILGEALSHISIYRSEISNLETSPLLNTLENLIRGVDDCHAPEHEDMIVELKQQLEELRPCLSATPSIEFTDIRKAPTDIFNNPLSPEDEVSIEMEEVSLLGNRKA